MPRRSWGRPLSALVLVGGLALDWPVSRALATGAETEVRRESSGAGLRTARRRSALTRMMDEMANERLRCRERFQKPRQVAECEAQFERLYRRYNEQYLDAARD